MSYANFDATASRYIVPGDPEWPVQLAALSSASASVGLWVLGDARLNELAENAVAVTGARASSGYGDVVAAEMGCDLAASGLTVVTGGAYGIDAAALRGALGAAAAPPVVIQASGLDCLYPAGHRDLFRSVVGRGGLLVSECPFGEPPTRFTFEGRNRLVAALSKGVVLVEAAARSGARSVITWATELGRPVMAIPGPVTSATSVLPHQLIRSGEAVMVTDAREVITLLDLH
ncbi:DNA-processing protein DprA [Propionicimonas sp.]|uniref:DNA-processing protein DprA n=1 Tax=Propionicimonas sp. TaxID=1955623 RepID=UPI0017A82B27|nr:DNA-processing protein DprA [Propionicimonas sp.]MBA3019609.1 hypothetical protein [Propionicimonas sp.]MBU4208045.1 DNA-protecting protein DprA [Actinomycetota bacterium]MBU4411500.1 DNA-protecting protein DprA [Actinomycetota bacterium]MCG2805729.1 DNA-protecting protein DprA [Propionicimonas sp.]